MTLPNFPIRTRLIPYDDLGIQEVSPNLLSLQNDVDIVLAALMAMGKNGSQMLQADSKGNLRVGAGITGDTFGDYQKITLVDTTTLTDSSFTFSLDISKYSALILIFHSANWAVNDNNIDFFISFLSNHGDKIPFDDVFLTPSHVSQHEVICNGVIPGISGNMLDVHVILAGTTPSVDIYIDAFVI